MNYIKITETGTTYPYLLNNLYNEYPNTCFPSPIDDNTLAEFNIFFVNETFPPPYNRATHKVVELTPTKVDDKYVQAWEVVEQNEQEKAFSSIIIRNEIVSATQNRLDFFARGRLYDGILSLCTYATSPNPKFAAEGQKGVELRDATWTKLYEVLEEVQNGTRPMPSSYEEIEGELPMLTWE